MRSSTANAGDRRLHRRQPRRVRGRAQSAPSCDQQECRWPRARITTPRRAARRSGHSVTPNWGRPWRRSGEDNYRVYRVRKLSKAARRAGHDVGRDQVARLMRAAASKGCAAGEQVRTTKAVSRRGPPSRSGRPRSRRYRARPALGDRSDVSCRPGAVSPTSASSPTRSAGSSSGRGCASRVATPSVLDPDRDRPGGRGRTRARA